MDTLIAEHIQIKRLTTVLFAAAERHAHGRPLRPEFFLWAAEFIRGYADGIHHCKEEDALFVVLKDGMGKAVEALLGEHALARQYTRAMELAAHDWQAGDEAALAVTVQNARRYAALLHEHIAHEETLLFPIAKWLLMPDEQVKLAAHFTQLDQPCADAGQYLALLDTLETEIGNQQPKIYNEEFPMQATDILSSEHRVIERVLAAINTAANRLEAGENIRPGFFLDAAQFIRGFADGCHHRKEEGVLFQIMVENGMPVEGGPIGMMLYEHDQGRAYTKGMREAAEKLQSGNASAKPEVIANARGYAALLAQHIHKEDNILFPMAGRVIPEDQHGAVLEGFEHVEHEETGEGVHEKYLALAETLEKEMA